MKRESMCVLVHRERDVGSYCREYLSIYVEEKKMTMLTSHLIIGYEGLSLISELLCEGKCSIRTKLKSLSNPKEKLEKKNVFSFLKSLSLFSCIYGIYPGELSEVYLLNVNLLNMYLSILLLSEKREVRSLMQIFGLHPMIFWTSRFCFDFVISLIYSFYLWKVFSWNDGEILQGNSMTFEQILKEKNLKMKKEFFLNSFILSVTNLPFVYLMTSSF